MTYFRFRHLPALAAVSSIAAVLLAAAPSAGGGRPEHGPPTTGHAVPSESRAADSPRSPVSGSRAVWADLLRDHLARYPLAQAEDVYKFVHQSVFGPAHAIPSRDEAGKYLDEELATLRPGPAGEPLLDVLSDDPPLARINLRPYVAGGGDRKRLLDAFVATASRIHGNAAIMKERLDVAGAVLRKLGRAAVVASLAELALDRAGNGYPAAHHSETYRDAYQPAYRVVLRPLLAAPP